jgi:hypothetical protein
VIASKTGIVSQLNTEDSNAGGGIEGALGMYGLIAIDARPQSDFPRRGIVKSANQERGSIISPSPSAIHQAPERSKPLS